MAYNSTNRNHVNFSDVTPQDPNVSAPASASRSTESALLAQNREVDGRFGARLRRAGAELFGNRRAKNKTSDDKRSAAVNNRKRTHRPMSESTVKFIAGAALLAVVGGGGLALHTIDTTPDASVTYHVDSEDRTVGYKGHASNRIYLTNTETGEQTTVEAADLISIMHFDSSDIYHGLGTVPKGSSIEITEQRGVRIPLISEFPNIISFKVVDGAK